MPTHPTDRNPSPRDRIYEADLDAVGFAYLGHTGLPWLAWPLRTADPGEAEWVAWIVRAVAAAPVCGRTADDALAELARIRHPKLARLLPKVRALVAG